MNLGFLIFALLAFNFILANAENYTVSNGNQTVHITINPNITVEPQDLTKLENLVEKLTNKPDLTSGDIIISSSTIVAFFSFGSFLVLRFEGQNKNEKYDEMKVVLVSVAVIQIMHLIIIGNVVINNPFSQSLYLLVIFLTVIFIVRILVSILRIHDLTKNEEEKKDIKTEDVMPLIAALQTAETDRDNYRREASKAKHEEGD